MKQIFTTKKTIPWKTAKHMMLLFFVLVIAATHAFSQATNATVSGKVSDDEGQPMIGASVLLKNESTGFVAGGITSSSGTFRGFDQATRTYRYSVETGVGVEPINGNPWRLQLGLRYAF